MINIGCHLSSSKGFAAMGREALSINASTFQFFARNPRGGAAKAFDEEDAKALNEILKQNAFAPILVHAPYTMNCASANPSLREFAIKAMQDDLYRASFLQNAMYNFHPGSHVGQGAEIGMELIANALNTVIIDEKGPLVLLETMAGKGSEIGGRFEELQKIIERVNIKNRVAVCVDTCHILDAGYNITDDIQMVLDNFDRTIGIEKLKAVHLNDSVHGLGSHKDRHAKIGEGHIGLAAFAKIINNKQLKELPFYLETPCDLNGYAAEIKLLKGLCE